MAVTVWPRRASSVHFRDRRNRGGYDGFNVHAALTARPELEPLVHHEDEWFLLDVLRRPQ
jgi:hypothetical protein